MKAEKQGPLRKVAEFDQLRVSEGKYLSIWYLECGHQLKRKGSVPRPKRAHCPECRVHADVKLRTVRTCRVCGCTNRDCSGCIERTGEPCTWVEADLCSACVGKG